MSQRLIFIGDCHGKVSRLLSVIDSLPATARIFQLGDMGLGFPDTHLPKQKSRFRWIRGNHDDPAQCRAHPNYLGDYGYLPDLKLFYLAGAWSIDWKWRRAHMQAGGAPVWWADEELAEQELGEAFKLYRESKPELVMSHECPDVITNRLLADHVIPIIGTDTYYNAKLECKSSRTAKWLGMMFAEHQPKLWVFGHYHIDKELELLGTKFRCCAELSTYEHSLEEIEVSA
jgi:hypothetical protein